MGTTATPSCIPSYPFRLNVREPDRNPVIACPTCIRDSDACKALTVLIPGNERIGRQVTLLHITQSHNGLMPTSKTIGRLRS